MNVESVRSGEASFQIKCDACFTECDVENRDIMSIFRDIVRFRGIWAFDEGRNHPALVAKRSLSGVNEVVSSDIFEDSRLC